MILPTYPVVKALLAAGVFSISTAAVAINSRNPTGSNYTSTASGLLNTPVQIASAEVHDYISDNKFNPAIYRDGGGGGFINGYHVIAFADTFTTEHPGTVNGSVNSFVHNSFAYMGYRNKKDPTTVYDFGSSTHPNGKRTFLETGLSAQDNETEAEFTVSIWPNSNMIPLKGSSALAVYTVYDADALVALYNTVAVINVTNPKQMDLAAGSTLTVTRPVPRLFYANENLYGSFATYKATGLVGEPLDKNIYFFSTSQDGIKVARVAGKSVYLRDKFFYWDGEAWSSMQPNQTDQSASIIDWNYVNFLNNATYGPGSGDVFWSPYFQTYVVVFQGDGIASDFYISYSETQKITGPYTIPQDLFSPPTNEMCEIYSPGWTLNYAGHAYPAWDVTGQTLLLSWSTCNAWTTMATVSFV